jgi:glutathione S-transferase
MSKYILHYFGANGRGAIPRAILTYAKANWTNDIIKKEDWPKIKKSELCEYEFLPVLEVDGKKYCESIAIDSYLAEKFNLMGKNPDENYQIFNLLGTFDDFNVQFRPFRMCEDESKKPELKQKAVDRLKFFIAKFEKKYVELGKGKYFLGDKLTLADFYIGVALIGFCQTVNEFPFKEVGPNLGELVERLKRNELKEFYEKYFFQ